MKAKGGKKSKAALLAMLAAQAEVLLPDTSYSKDGKVTRTRDGRPAFAVTQPPETEKGDREK